MAESPSKRPETEENADRISSLPESLLYHILSFLPTKTCVATSILSRRWLHLWKHLQVLDFDDDVHYHERLQRFQRFAVFVNGVLSLRSSREIRKMRLSRGHSVTDTFYAHSIDTWILAAVGPHIQELHLKLVSSDRPRRSDRILGPSFLIPVALFNCPNLVSLRLCGGIHVRVQRSSAVRLPSLKMLELKIGCVDVDSVNTLLSGCPILETLDLTFYAKFSTKVRIPPLPSLKRLKFKAQMGKSYLQIDAPDLKYLSIVQREFGAVGNLQNVVEAYVDVFPGLREPYDGLREPVDSLLNFLRALSGTKHLLLQRFTTEWLLTAPVLDFPDFRYLLHLELILPCFNTNFLLNVLQKCHVLQVLIIKSNKYDPSRYPSTSPSLALQSTSVPNCLVSHLSSFHFDGYRGFEDELAFAEYIFSNGLVLKTMTIIDFFTSLDLSKKNRILERFSDIPRGSAMCQLKFDIEPYRARALSARWNDYDF